MAHLRDSFETTADPGDKPFATSCAATTVIKRVMVIVLNKLTPREPLHPSSHTPIQDRDLDIQTCPYYSLANISVYSDSAPALRHVESNTQSLSLPQLGTGSCRAHIAQVIHTRRTITFDKSSPEPKSFASTIDQSSPKSKSFASTKSLVVAGQVTSSKSFPVANTIQISTRNQESIKVTVHWQCWRRSLELTSSKHESWQIHESEGIFCWQPSSSEFFGWDEPPFTRGYATIALWESLSAATIDKSTKI